MAVGLCTILLAAVAVEARDGERRADPRPLARSHEDGPRRAQRAASPRPVVLKLKHISAESIMEVVEQLRNSDTLGKVFRQVPIAVCREANALVLFGPPEMIELFERIVCELDAPSEYHERMRERGMRQGRRDREPRAKRPGPDEGPAPLGERIGRAIERLLSPEARKRLGIDEHQARKIHEIGGQAKEQMMHLRERVSRAMRQAGPDRREALARQVGPNVRQRAMELMRETHKRIAEVLRPEQREAIERMRREQGQREGEPRPRDEREREEPRREARGRDHEARAERGRREPRREREPGDPFAETLEHVLAPPIARKIGLKEDQAARIREVAQDLRREMQKLHEHARHEIGQAEPRKRSAVAREIEAHLGEKTKGLMHKLREAIGRILTPDQRERLEKIHHSRAEGDEEHSPRRGERDKGEPDRRRERGREPDRDREHRDERQR